MALRYLFGAKARLGKRTIATPDRYLRAKDEALRSRLHKRCSCGLQISAWSRPNDTLRWSCLADCDAGVPPGATEQTLASIRSLVARLRALIPPADESVPSSPLFVSMVPFLAAWPTTRLVLSRSSN